MSNRQYSIKAFPVTYKGINYQSSLEGRWAVFLDTLKVPFSPQPDGFRLPSGGYAPDFWLPEQGVFVEIKPTKPTPDEEKKAEELAFATRYPVFVFYGLPLDSKRGGISFDPEGYSDEDYYFTECPTCGIVEIVWAGLINNLSCKHSTDGNPNYESEKLTESANKARRFKFENSWNPRS